MRVRSDTQRLDLAPGGRAEVHLDVVNTSGVIDGVSARVIGLDTGHVSANPPLLPLFPNSEGRLTLTLGVPATFPAGRHPVTVELASRTESAPPQHVDLDLLVASRPAADLRVRPGVLRAGRRGRFRVQLTNTGNVPVELALSAADAERSLGCDFAPRTLRAEAGTTAMSVLTVRAPRHLFGSPIDRGFTVTGTGSGPADGLDFASPGILRQRPLIARGVFTALVLAFIVGLWALAFLLGLTKVFVDDPVTKTAPASFFGSSEEAGRLVASTVPGGLVPKTGVLPAGVGGGISGRVTAATTGEGAGRIVVAALRQTPSGRQLVTSAATQADGSYRLVGLFPGSYVLRFSAHGYRTVYYPAAPAESGAKAVTARPQQVRRGVNVSITGLPATLTGQVDHGDTLAVVPTTIVARPLQGSGPALRTTADAAGRYRLTGLPAPGRYELSITAPGYQPTTVVERLTGGQTRFQPTVRLSAGAGSISGIVTDGTAPLGGVTVTTTLDGRDIASATPTLGTVGRFSLGNLPTPATYIVTFTREGFGAHTVVVDLGPGAVRSDLKVSLVGGTGTVTGRLIDGAGKGLGGATVTVGGTAVPTETTTLTAGDVGLFALSGLPTPGSYTLTFSLPGYSPQTVPLLIAPDVPAPAVTVTLTRGLGSIAGRVLDGGGKPMVGLTVSVTDGKDTWKATTVNAADRDKAGAFLVPELRPGSYAVTVTKAGHVPQTALVTVTAGARATQDLRLLVGD